MTTDHYESLDLRVPVQYLMQRWAWIVGAGILAAIAAAVFTFWLPVVYGAEATVAISPSRTEIQFDPRIETLADYELLSGTLVSRRDALIALVQSNDVVLAVLSDVEEHLLEEERNIEWLRSASAVAATGDLINLEIRHANPETAALIANTWIAHYQQHVNELYSTRGNVSDSRIAEQVNEARETYSTAQVALESYEAANPVEILQRELDSTLAVLENYQQARILAQTRPSDRNQLILDMYYQELAQIEGWLADAVSLHEQVAEDTGSEAGNLGNMLALITLRSRVFGGEREGGAGIFLQFDISSPAAEAVSPADVDALIVALEERQRAAEARVDAFLQDLPVDGQAQQLVPLNEQIQRLTEEITTLRSEIEAANAEQRELAQARDNAWETHQLLQQRQIEEQIASQTPSVEVRIADRAIIPLEPVGRGLIRNTALAAALGGLVAAGMVLVRAWWRMGDESEARVEGPDRERPLPHDETQ